MCSGRPSFRASGSLRDVTTVPSICVRLPNVARPIITAWLISRRFGVGLFVVIMWVKRTRMHGDRCAPLARERVAPFEPSGSLSACRYEVPVSRCCVPLSWRPSSKGGMAIGEFREPLRPTPNSCHTMRQWMRREPMGFLTWIRVSALFGSRARSPSAGTVSVLLGPTVQGRQSTSSRAGPLRWI